MYPLKFHPGLDKRWQTFSEYQQIVMIANELNRALNMLYQDDIFEMKQALERAFELVDLTVEKARYHLKYELLRFREMLGDVYINLDTDVGRCQRLQRMLISLNPQAFNALT